MKSAEACIQNPEQRTQQFGFLQKYAKQILLNRLNNLGNGQLIVQDGEERYSFGKQHARFPQRVTVTVTHPSFYTKMLMNGALGAGEAYMDGSWHCDDLTKLIQLFLCNRSHIEDIGPGLKWFAKPAQLLLRYLNRNTLAGSRRNIEAHYDLGNDLFEQFLDPSMMYSSGIFHHVKTTLQEASNAKLAAICEKLQLSRSDHVLEIGTGWGGFALYAAKHYGCHITTTTISKRQYEYTKLRIQEAGLDDQITLLLKDYRELNGSYDKLISIEMIEAIGHRYYNGYFSKCSNFLKPEGMMLLQSITIADQRYDVAKKSVDFIQRYIFPGGCLPSVAALSDGIARNTDMRIFHLEDIGPHYATTLKHWRTRFFDNIDHVRKLGYSENFIRMWEYYMCYCEGGFREQVIGTVQLLLTKPQALRAPIAHTQY